MVGITRPKSMRRRFWPGLSLTLGCRQLNPPLGPTESRAGLACLQPWVWDISLGSSCCQWVHHIIWSRLHGQCYSTSVYTSGIAYSDVKLWTRASQIMVKLVQCKHCLQRLGFPHTFRGMTIDDLGGGGSEKAPLTIDWAVLHTIQSQFYLTCDVYKYLWLYYDLV